MYTKICPDPMQAILELFSNKLLENFYCHRIGKIYTFDPTTQIASVELLDKMLYQGKYQSPPLLPNCPVLIDIGNTKPIQKGDYCIVYFNDVDIDNWFNDNLSQIPRTKRKHDLKDCIVQVLHTPNKVTKLTNYDNTARVLSYNGHKVRISDNKIEILTTSGSKIELDSLIKIANNSQNLKDIMNNLITTNKTLIDLIKTLQVLDPISGPLPITNGTVLDTVKSTLDIINNNINALLK